MNKENNGISSDYKLHGLPITPTGIQDLILELFSGQTAERHQIVTAVGRIHIERGGIPARAADFSRSVKKALTSLKDLGAADNPAYGFWRIKHKAEVEKLVIPVEEIIESLEPYVVQAENTLGEGSSFVYLYYFPAYRKNAQHDNCDVWPCKIGRSERDPISRIYSQASTALPEAPLIGMLLRTSLPSQWERVIHIVLALRGRIIEDSPGDEWFNTSPNEVMEIIHLIDPSIKRA